MKTLIALLAAFGSVVLLMMMLGGFGFGDFVMYYGDDAGKLCADKRLET